jgi:uncharacterized protein (DUF2141 family)
VTAGSLRAAATGAAVAAAVTLTAAGPVRAAALTVQLQGLQNAKHSVVVSVFDGPRGFPSAKSALHRVEAPARRGTVSVTVDGLAPGRYAVAAFHDENGNGTLDRFMGLIPREGWGLSTNPQLRSPPRFRQIAFELPEGGRTIAIRMSY